MARVLLLLPTGTYRAPDFLAAARALGVEVVVASEQEAALAEARGDRALTVDLEDVDGAVESIVGLDARSPIDAVVAVDERGVTVAAGATTRLGLPGNPPEAAARSRDKAALRRALAAREVPQPAFAVVAPGEDVGAAAASVGFPCVVKPVSLSASQGVLRADSAEEAVAAAELAWSLVPAGEPVVVEAYVPGEEVAVEGLLRDGVLTVLAVFDKPDPLVGPTFAETLYVTPSRHPASVLAAAAALTGQACAAIGLVDGPIHAELRLPPDGGPVVLEVAARTIGGLCARTLRFGLGVSLEELVLRHAIGRRTDHLRRQQEASGVMMLPVPQAGVLRDVRGWSDALAVDGIVGGELTIVAGRTVEPLPRGSRYLGFLFARGPTPAAVETALRTATSRLDVRID